MLIAIDGPVGAGKSTVARAVASELGFTYLDTGAMYRAVALLAHESRQSAEQTLSPATLASSAQIDFQDGQIVVNGRDVSGQIRSPEVSQMASTIAVDSAVREALVDRQREITRQGNWVAEGRDIGTVVRPDAELKIFLTAADEERAGRRAADTGRTLEVELADLRERDERDRNREVSPLRQADDAVEVDSTGLTLDEVVAKISQLAHSIAATAKDSGSTTDFNGSSRR